MSDEYLAHSREGWLILRLKQVVSLRSDRVVGDAQQDNYLGLENVESWTGKVTRSEKSVREEERDTPENIVGVFHKGDILFGKLRPYLAKAFLADFSGVCSTEFLVMRPKDFVDPRYLLKTILTHQFIDEVDATTFGVRMPRANWDAISNISVPIPPLATQRAIADYLDRETARIDGLIGAKQRLLALLAEKRFAAINEAVSYGLDSQTRLINDPNIPWLDGIPSHWTIEQGRYLFTQSSLPVRDEDEIVTCFRDGQVTLRRNRRTEGFTNAILELGYQGIRTGQLVIHSMDAFAGAIGISDSNGKCSPEYIVCDAKTYHVFLPYYSHLLRVMALKGFIQASCPAVRERAPRIRFTDLSDMFFPLPPYGEQVRVAEHIKSAIKKIDALRNHTLEAISLLQERRTALIAAAVTGQIDMG